MNDPTLAHAHTNCIQNRWLTVETDDVQLPSGRQYEYTRLVGPGIGVAVIGFNAAGETVEREYRHGGRSDLAAPGGLIHEGEELIIGGLRVGGRDRLCVAQVTPESVRYLGSLGYPALATPATSSPPGAGTQWQHQPRPNRICFAALGDDESLKKRAQWRG
jgi:hypothetical protein